MFPFGDHHFPRSNLYNLDLDWILEKFSTFSGRLDAFIKTQDSFNQRLTTVEKDVNRRLTQVESDVAKLPQVAAEAGKKAAEAAVTPAVNKAVPPAVSKALETYLPKTYNATVKYSWSGSGPTWTQTVSAAGVKSSGNYGLPSFRKTGNQDSDKKAEALFNLIMRGFISPGNGVLNLTVYEQPPEGSVTIYFQEVQ